jgi:hypothetical protein
LDPLSSLTADLDLDPKLVLISKSLDAQDYEQAAFLKETAKSFDFNDVSAILQEDVAEESETSDELSINSDLEGVQMGHHENAMALCRKPADRFKVLVN